MSGTLLLVHSGHKTCTGQITEQVLLIDTVGRKGENGRVGWLSQVWLYCAGAWPNRVLQQFCYFYLTIQLQKCPWQTGIQLYTCIVFISEARPSILEGQILWIDTFFYEKNVFFVISRLMIVLFRPDPATNRNSAILVVQFSDCTATDVHGRFGRFGVFSWPHRIFYHNLGGTMACTRAQSTPWIPRRPAQCRFAFAQHKNEIPNAPEKGLFGGPIL